ncbi:hypothetical protein I7I48_09114 [Histoplasma ohiense]|nr:hypothetical protein I7I48_09114 [Histoplasma ohiense (nom. inval.)]
MEWRLPLKHKLGEHAILGACRGCLLIMTRFKRLQRIKMIKTLKRTIRQRRFQDGCPCPSMSRLKTGHDHHEIFDFS